MSTKAQVQAQAKTPAAPAATHVAQLPVAVPEREADRPDIATQLEGAARLGHSLGAIRVDGPAPPLVQRQEMPEEEEEEEPPMQREPAAVQRQEMPEEEEEELQLKREPDALQRQELLEEEEEEELQMMPETAALQRQGMPDEEGDLQSRPVNGMQRQSGGEGFQLDDETVSRISRARGSGQALDGALQEQMSMALGHDFSGVRVHTNAEADSLNQQLSARAFTTGRDIFFRQSEYSPGSGSGRNLLAHELIHVVQQSSGRVHGGGNGMIVRHAGDTFEQEADAMGLRSCQKGSAAPGWTAGRNAASSSYIQREKGKGDSILARFFRWLAGIRGEEEAIETAIGPELEEHEQIAGIEGEEEAEETAIGPGLSKHEVIANLLRQARTKEEVRAVLHSRAARDELSSKAAGGGFEVGVIVDASGKVLAAERGAERTVDPEDVSKVIKPQGAEAGEASHPIGGTLIHNHPDGTPLSQSDLTSAFRRGYRRVEAVMSVPGFGEQVITFAEVEPAMAGGSVEDWFPVHKAFAEAQLDEHREENDAKGGWGKWVGLASLNKREFEIDQKLITIKTGMERVDPKAYKAAMLEAYGPPTGRVTKATRRAAEPALGGGRTRRASLF